MCGVGDGRYWVHGLWIGKGLWKGHFRVYGQISISRVGKELSGCRDQGSDSTITK